MNIAIIDSVWTVVVMIIFLGIVIWAWSGKRKKDFDEAANIPFTEDAPASRQQKSEENSNG